MLHPRLTALGAALGGTSSQWLAQIGPYGSWGDLQLNTRWGDGACGMYEAQWSMPLPAEFEHPLLRRGTVVELMDGPWRVGSPLVLAEPARGTGLDDPWHLVAAGIGREVEGENSFYAVDGTGSFNGTAVPSTGVDAAIVNGWRIAGRAGSVPTTAIGGSTTTDELMTVGSLLNAAGESLGQRWYVGQDNILAFAADPTTATYQIVPGVASLGTADDDYASLVWLRYWDSATGLYKTVFSSNANVASTFARREYAVSLIDKGQVSTATAQAWADGILARSKGRLAWTNGLTVTSNDILTMGGTPANLSKVLEDVASGCMIRLHGDWSDLLAYNGQTYIDIVIGEARYTDGAQTIDLNPLGMAKRDLAAIIEDVTGKQET